MLIDTEVEVSNGTSMPPARSGSAPVLPDHPEHPDHVRYQQILTGVERLGRWPQQEVRNVTAALYADVARNPGMQRIDDVVLGSPLVAPQQVFAVYRPHGDRLPVFHSGVPVTAAAFSQPGPAAAQSYVDRDGYLVDPGVTRRPVAALEHGTLQGPHAIIMHRTGGATAASALSAFASGTGTHFLIDKDGTIYQTAGLDQKTHHVGKIKSRCFEEGTCTPEEHQKLDRLGFAPKAIHDLEKAKAYPQRYPMNEDSGSKWCRGIPLPAGSRPHRNSGHR